MSGSGGGAPVVIGGIPLVGFGVPAQLGYGTTTEVASTRIPGGQKAVQALGTFPDDIVLDGWLEGPTQQADAAQFIAMQAAQQPVALFANGIQLGVLIKRFLPTMQRGWTRFGMLLEVLPAPPAPQPASGAAAMQSAVADDASAGSVSLATGSAVPEMDDAVLDDAGLAGLADTQDSFAAPLSQAAAGISATGAAAAVPGALAGSGAVSNALGVAQGAQGALDQAQGAIEGGIGTANGFLAGGWSAATSIGTQAAALLGFAGYASGMLPSVMAAGGFVGRAARNLAAAAPLSGATPAPAQPGSVAAAP